MPERVIQGSPLSMALFCLAILPLLDDALQVLRSMLVTLMSMAQ